MAKDFLNQELHVGDEVIYLQHYKTSSWLYRGIIKTLSPKTAVLEDLRRKSLDKLIKINREMLLVKAKHIWDDDYEVIGICTSAESVEQIKAEYLRNKSEANIGSDEYTFEVTKYEVDKLS